MPGVDEERFAQEAAASRGCPPAGHRRLVDRREFSVLDAKEAVLAANAAGAVAARARKRDGDVDARNREPEDLLSSYLPRPARPAVGGRQSVDLGPSCDEAPTVRAIHKTQAGDRRIGEDDPPRVAAIISRQQVEARLAGLAGCGSIPFEDPPGRRIDELNVLDRAPAGWRDGHDADARPAAPAVSGAVQDVAAPKTVRGRRRIAPNTLDTAIRGAEQPAVSCIDELKLARVDDLGRQIQLRPLPATVRCVKERPSIRPPRRDPAELSTSEGLRRHLKTSSWIRGGNLERTVARDRINTYGESLTRNPRSLGHGHHPLRLSPLGGGQTRCAHAPALAGERPVQAPPRIPV